MQKVDVYIARGSDVSSVSGNWASIKYSGYVWEIYAKDKIIIEIRVIIVELVIPEKLEKKYARKQWKSDDNSDLWIWASKLRAISRNSGMCIQNILFFFNYNLVLFYRVAARCTNDSLLRVSRVHRCDQCERPPLEMHINRCRVHVNTRTDGRTELVCVYMRKYICAHIHLSPPSQTGTTWNRPSRCFAKAAHRRFGTVSFCRKDR